MAGQAPIVALDTQTAIATGLPDTAALSGVKYKGQQVMEPWRHVLFIPTLHVHGLRDPGLERHRILFTESCSKGSTRLVEWDGDHRLPIKRKDVRPVAENIISMARQTGVLKGWDFVLSDDEEDL
jgi:hypothetical protein